MGWEASGTDEQISNAMAMADSDPKMLMRDIQSQKQAAMEIQQAKMRARELRRKQATTMEEIQEQMNEKGYVHGDSFMLIREDGELMSVKLDLRPLPTTGPMPRFVEQVIGFPSLDWHEKAIDLAKRKAALATVSEEVSPNTKSD